MKHINYLVLSALAVFFTSFAFAEDLLVNGNQEVKESILDIAMKIVSNPIVLTLIVIGIYLKFIRK